MPKHLMIVQIVDVHGVSVLETKRHPPVAGDRNRVMAPKGALQRMQSKAGQIHAPGSAAPVQRRQDAPQLGNVVRRDSRRAPGLVKRLQATVTKRFDHPPIVWCRLTVVNRRFSSIRYHAVIPDARRARKPEGFRRARLAIRDPGPPLSAGGHGSRIARFTGEIEDFG